MKRLSDFQSVWQLQLPVLQALEPWGVARLSRLFKLMPVHPDSARMDAAFYEWGLRSGLYTAETAQDLKDLSMGYLVYWLAPRASKPVAWMMGTFCLWVTAVDDVLAERGAALADVKRACDEVIRTGQTGFLLTPASRYFLELRQEVTALGGAELLPQIADQVEYSFLTWEREQRFIRDDSLPSLPGYLQLRIGTPALGGPLQVQRCEKGLLPPRRYLSEKLERLAALVNIITAIEGDVLGYRRDFEKSPHPMNIILVIALDLSVDLATAYRMSIDLIELYKHIFDSLVAEVCADPGPDPEAPAQARAMADWLDGFHTWYTNNHRHGKADAEAQAKDPARPAWQTGPLWQALSQCSGNEVAPYALADKRFSAGPTGIGTSAARSTAEKEITPAERLKSWATDSLGWSGARDHRASSGATAVAVRVPNGPSGLGISAARIPALSGGKTAAK